MKFSYTLLKKINPAIKSKKWLEEQLTDYLFEVDEIKEDMIDIAVLANRYSDAASHLGIAADLSATEGKKFKWPGFEVGLPKTSEIKIEVKEPQLCPRYLGVVIEIKENGESPEYIKQVLRDCGQKPINAVVDVMNYVMLLSGQPMHAFDYGKISGDKIIVRKAKEGEKIVTLDNQDIKLTKEMLVIADEEKPLAIAGIKGGKTAEVDGRSRKLVLEAASFNQESIFKTSRELRLITDASLRFSHNLNADLVGLGMNQAVELLEKVCGGKVVGQVQAGGAKSKVRKILFDADRYRKLVGDMTSTAVIKKRLVGLGFEIKNPKGEKFTVETPRLRDDVQIFEDVAEEVVRIGGVNKVKPEPPHLAVRVPEKNERISFKRKLQGILAGLGMDEVYLSTFVGEGDADSLEVINPAAIDRRYLRQNIREGVLSAAGENLKWFEEAGVFEIGKVFKKRGKEVEEETHIGLALVNRREDRFLELKGIIEELLRRMGLVQFEMREEAAKLSIFSDGKKLGEIKEERQGAAAEINFDLLEQLTEEENEYEEIIKYPTILRDISILVDVDKRVGNILREIQGVDFEEIRDVDLIDFYQDSSLGDNLKSLTFRIVLQAKDRSLKDAEADRIVRKITEMLEVEFGAEVR